MTLRRVNPHLLAKIRAEPVAVVASIVVEESLPAQQDNNLQVSSSCRLNCPFFAVELDQLFGNQQHPDSNKSMISPSLYHRVLSKVQSISEPDSSCAEAVVTEALAAL